MSNATARGRRSAQEIIDYTNEQIRLGLHGPARTLCHGCREWCDGIYTITQDGKHLGECCGKEKKEGQPHG